MVQPKRSKRIVWLAALLVGVGTSTMTITTLSTIASTILSNTTNVLPVANALVMPRTGIHGHGHGHNAIHGCSSCFTQQQQQQQQQQQRYCNPRTANGSRSKLHTNANNNNNNNMDENNTENNQDCNQQEQELRQRQSSRQPSRQPLRKRKWTRFLFVGNRGSGSPKWDDLREDIDGLGAITTTTATTAATSSASTPRNDNDLSRTTTSTTTSTTSKLGRNKVVLAALALTVTLAFSLLPPVVMWGRGGLQLAVAVLAKGLATALGAGRLVWQALRNGSVPAVLAGLWWCKFVHDTKESSSLSPSLSPRAMPDGTTSTDANTALASALAAISLLPTDNNNNNNNNNNRRDDHEDDKDADANANANANANGPPPVGIGNEGNDYDNDDNDNDNNDNDNDNDDPLKQQEAEAEILKTKAQIAASEHKIRKLRASIADLSEEKTRDLKEVQRRGLEGGVNLVRGLREELRDFDHYLSEARSAKAVCEAKIARILAQMSDNNNKNNKSASTAGGLDEARLATESTRTVGTTGDEGNGIDDHDDDHDDEILDDGAVLVASPSEIDASRLKQTSQQNGSNNDLPKVQASTSSSNSRPPEETESDSRGVQGDNDDNNAMNTTTTTTTTKSASQKIATGDSQAIAVLPSGSKGNGFFTVDLWEVLLRIIGYERAANRRTVAKSVNGNSNKAITFSTGRPTSSSDNISRSNVMII